MIRQQLPGVPIMALTATAAPQVTSIICSLASLFDAEQAVPKEPSHSN